MLCFETRVWTHFLPIISAFISILRVTVEAFKLSEIQQLIGLVPEVSFTKNWKFLSMELILDVLSNKLSPEVLCVTKTKSSLASTRPI